MTHSSTPTFEDAGYETINEDAKTILTEDGNIGHEFESDAQPVGIDDAQHAIADNDGNLWLVDRVVVHLKPVVVK